MKKLSALLLMLGLAGTQAAMAQCSPAPRATGTTFAYGVTDSVSPFQTAPQPYVVCDNASLYYVGNDPDTVYLEGSAQLYVESCFNLVVYMRNNSQLRCGTSPGTRVFKDILYDPTFTTFVDTAGTTIQNMTACPAMSYNYMHFPSGASPCGGATSVGGALAAAAWGAYPNPAQGMLHLQLPADWHGPVQASLHSMDGRSVATTSMVGPQAQMDLDHLPAGNYLLRLTLGSKMVARIVAVE
jgi:Secretion system C-terminal sorting domain